MLLDVGRIFFKMENDDTAFGNCLFEDTFDRAVGYALHEKDSAEISGADGIERNANNINALGGLNVLAKEDSQGRSEYFDKLALADAGGAMEIHHHGLGAHVGCVLETLSFSLKTAGKIESKQMGHFLFEHRIGKVSVPTNDVPEIVQHPEDEFLDLDFEGRFRTFANRRIVSSQKVIGWRV